MEFYTSFTTKMVSEWSNTEQPKKATSEKSCLFFTSAPSCSSDHADLCGHSRHRQGAAHVPLHDRGVGLPASDHAVFGNAGLGTLQCMVLVSRLKFQVMFAILKPVIEEEQKATALSPWVFRAQQGLCMPYTNLAKNKNGVY